MFGYTGKRRSAFWCLLGTLTIVVGFNGLVVDIYSQATLQLEGYNVFKLDDIKSNIRNNYSKVSILANVVCDDNIKMPDDNMSVVKGKLLLTACWPDGGQQILIDWQNETNYLKVSSPLFSNGVMVDANSIECFQDSTSMLDNLKVDVVGNRISVDYFKYHFNLTGNAVRGMPVFKIKREYLPLGGEVILAGADFRSVIGARVIKTDYVVPLEVAKNRVPKINTLGKVSIMFIVLGIAMFFIPEGLLNSKHYNTITNFLSNHNPFNE